MPKYYIRVSKKLKKIYLSGCYSSFNADGATEEFGSVASCVSRCVFFSAREKTLKGANKNKAKAKWWTSQ
jgi:hypothetical protein